MARLFARHGDCSTRCRRLRPRGPLVGGEYEAPRVPAVLDPEELEVAGGEAETEGRLDLRDHRGGQGRVPVRVRAPESSWIDHKTYAPEGFDRSLRLGAGSANRPALRPPPVGTRA